MITIMHDSAGGYLIKLDGRRKITALDSREVVVAVAHYYVVNEFHTVKRCPLCRDIKERTKK